MPVYKENIVILVGIIAVVACIYTILRSIISRLMKRVSNSDVAHLSSEALQTESTQAQVLKKVLIIACVVILLVITGLILARAAHTNIFPFFNTASLAGLALMLGAASLKIAVIIIAYFITRLILSKFIRATLSTGLAKLSGDILKTRKARVGALQSVLMSVVEFLLAFIAVLMITETIGFNIIPLITTASVAGLAIGFGAQKLVRDVISGFFILMEDQYGVGDFVTIGAVSGVVEDLEMRTTRIRDLTGKLYILSNGDITQVCNHSRGKLTLSVEYSLAPNTDLDKTCKLLNEVGQSIATDFPKEVKEPFKCDGLVQITAASNIIRLTGAVSPIAQEMIRIELNTRIRAVLEKTGIALA